MSARKQIRVSVAPDGSINAETLGFVGEECLDTVAVLEDLLDAVSVSSAFTEDYHRTTTTTTTEGGQSLGTGQG